jgi:hypothetical protein
MIIRWGELSRNRPTVLINPTKVFRTAEHPFRPVERVVRMVVGRPIQRLLLPERRRPFVLAGNWDRRTKAIDDIEKYQLVHDLVRHRDDFRASRLYRQMLHRIETEKVAHYKKTRIASVDELERFVGGYLIGLIDSLAQHGYRADLADSKGGFAMVGREGELIKGLSGQHRFYAIRALGGALVPLRVHCVHPLLLQRLQATDPHGIVAELKRIEAAHQ